MSAAESRKLKEQKKYWLGEFQDERPVLRLPIDYPRPPLLDFEGRQLFFDMDEGVLSKLEEWVQAEEMTLFTFLISAFSVFLSKKSGQDTIVIGTPVSLRTHPDLDHVIGALINTVAIKTHPISHKSFKTFLSEMQAKIFEVQRNADFPFDDLVEEIHAQKDLSRNPVFDVMFSLQQSSPPKLDPSGLKVETYHYDFNVARADLTLFAFESDDHFSFMFEYRKNLFRKETIELFGNQFIVLLKHIMEDVHRRIADLDYETKLEKDLQKIENIQFDF